jgi:hypothetical protein
MNGYLKRGDRGLASRPVLDQISETLKNSEAALLGSFILPLRVAGGVLKGFIESNSVSAISFRLRPRGRTMESDPAHARQPGI